jgi:hypothetical protein
VLFFGNVVARSPQGMAAAGRVPARFRRLMAEFGFNFCKIFNNSDPSA